MLVNYGMDEMRFGQPVITGSRVRLVATLHDIQNLRGICKTSIKFTIEIEGQREIKKKPLYYQHLPPSEVACFFLSIQQKSGAFFNLIIIQKNQYIWQQENG